MTRRVLGLGKDRTRSITLPPPFPREHRKIMILPQVRTTFAARESNFGAIAGLIAQMSDARNGNALVLFPSYQVPGKSRGTAAAHSRAAAGATSERHRRPSGRKSSTRWPRRRRAASCCSPFWAGCMPRAWIIRANF